MTSHCQIFQNLASQKSSCREALLTLKIYQNLTSEWTKDGKKDVASFIGLKGFPE